MSQFANFDFENFWENSEYAQKHYVSETFNDEMLDDIENELGFKLPKDYIKFMQYQNGGVLKKQVFPTKERTPQGDYAVDVIGIYGIGITKDYALCGNLGSQFRIDDWGYPNDCVYFADCPSAGHDMIAFDYSKCGKNGEPCVVHIDQESDYQKTFLAKDFKTFIENLVHKDDYDYGE